MAQPPLLESRERIVPGEGDLVEVIHACPAKGAVGDRKARRLDNVRLDAQAGAKPENRAGILRNVRLVKGDPHGGTGDVHASEQTGLYKRFMRLNFADARTIKPDKPRRFRA